MRTTFATLALIAAAGIGSAAYAQTTTQPGTTPSAPGGTTTMPGSGTPATKPVAGEAAAKAALEAKGYTGVKKLKRDNAGNWSGTAMKNNAEVAVMVDSTGKIREQ
ncbi:MAG: PepSY domain-containing protein [Proteobacteria bacterium]|jgi:hypothetical protein|uniref:hypothetical protein n=1 Tax=Reyranella massiliensis TaxID=445220 RepID=UPI0002D4A7A5|nr:hypothetical protein [Reyranella massiliensis]MCA0249036.1 PepSY domain-containing protein [Pseudomonadota bacterium]